MHAGQSIALTHSITRGTLLAGAGAERSLPRPRDTLRASIIRAREAALAAAVADVGACLQAEGIERTGGTGVISRQPLEGGCVDTRTSDSCALSMSLREKSLI